MVDRIGRMMGGGMARVGGSGDVDCWTQSLENFELKSLSLRLSHRIRMACTSNER